MMTAEQFRLRADPGPEYAWVWRIWWQHTAAEVRETDLNHMRRLVATVHDAQAMHTP